MTRGDLQRDLGSRVGSEITGAVNAPAVGDPVALGEHADHFCPTRVVAIRTIRRRVPFVWTEWSAGTVVALPFRRRPRAKARDFVERATVIRERRRAGLPGDPIN